MATKKSTAKTTKTTAKKATTKTSAKATSAKKTAAPKSTVDSVVENVTDAVEGVTERAEDAFETAVRFAKDASYTSIGAGLVVQERVSQRKFEMIDYKTFLDEAKTKGHEQVVEVQNFIEPIAERINERVEPIAERIEAQLPTQVRDAIVDGRERMSKLLSV